ncbi:hypothetical protein D3C84_986300 [compost metagenome]
MLLFQIIQAFAQRLRTLGQRPGACLGVIVRHGGHARDQAVLASEDTGDVRRIGGHRLVPLLVIEGQQPCRRVSTDAELRQGLIGTRA